MPPPLICHIIHRLDFGGLENGLVNLINELPAERYRHAIICLTYATEFRQRIRHTDVPIIEIRKRAGKDPAAYLRVWRALRQLRPSIVHTRNLPALDMLGVAAAAGVPRLVHGEHGLDVVELDGRNRKYNTLRKLSRLCVDQYITVSRELADWLIRDIGIDRSRVVTIYNGVDTARFFPGPSQGLLPQDFVPAEGFVIGTIGRLEEVKDQPTLVEAFCRMLALRPALKDRARLVIVGDGSLRDRISGQLAAHGAADLAWLPGFRADAAELMRALDLFVLPSRREGISNTILEAMATAKPVVATAVGGNLEIVVDGVTGSLVPAQDPDAMARRLLEYVDTPCLAAARGRAGQAAVMERFSLPSMLAAYQRVYDALA